MQETSNKASLRRRLNGFDYFVLAGGAMNLLVVFYLVGYWLLYG